VTLQHIKDLLHGSQPFTLRMVSGRAIEVPHPDFVALAPEGTFLVFIQGNGRIESIRISQIESIETHEGAANA
jgi:hypothetical protein